jgi:vitamin B12 transporter
MDKRAFAAAFLISLNIIASAQEEKEPPKKSERHEITVTATRLETPEREVASSVTVITGEDLRRMQKTSVLDAVRNLAELSIIQNGGEGGAASVSVRGANSEHTLVLLDGVELNDPINPSRSYDLAHLSLNQVERIEIIRGPQSVLFGSNAMGGVINIITRRGQGRPEITASTTAGSYGTIRGDYGISGSSGPGSYSLGASFVRAEGISAAAGRYPGNSEPDGYRNLSFAGNLGFDLGERAQIDLSMRTIRAETEIDNFGGPYGDDSNSSQKYTTLSLRGRFRSLSPSSRWEQTLTVSGVRSKRTLLNPVDPSHPDESEEGTYQSSLLKIDWQNNFFLRPTHTITAGLEVDEEEGRSDYVSESPWGIFESRFPSVRARAVGLYIQDRWTWKNRFFVTLGGRNDWNSRAGSALTFRIAPAYLIAKTGTKIKATLGTGFKSPSLYQLFAPGTAWGPVGNPNLEPERSTGWDAGIEQYFFKGRLEAGVSWFENSFRDLVDFDYALGYINIGQASTRGLEASLGLRPVEGPGFTASYTRLIARDQTTGEELLRRPRHRFSADLRNTFFARLDVALSVHVVGRRLDTDFSTLPYETVTLPAYALVNAVLSARIGPSFEVYVRLDNILDTSYQAVWGYGAPGFAFNSGFRLSL